MKHTFNLQVIHNSWQICLQQGLDRLDPHYIHHLALSKDWLPGPEKIFNAFSLPLEKVNYVLFGESPYPRRHSANGYAFWDAAVHHLWSETGLSKQVNRATSLRNLIKMLLIAEGLLTPLDTSQQAITKLSKHGLIQTNNELFTNFINKGFLLLNTTPILSEQSPEKDAKAFTPFIKEVLTCLIEHRPNVVFILFGRIAKQVCGLIEDYSVQTVFAEHPYNVSFITNNEVIGFFKSFHLLRPDGYSKNKQN